MFGVDFAFNFDFDLGVGWVGGGGRCGAFDACSHTHSKVDALQIFDQYLHVLEKETNHPQ